MARKQVANKPIRVGVLGLRRGVVFANTAAAAGMELVALCDSRKDRLKTAAKQHGAAAYTDFDRFLQHDMDAVVLANYFHEHAPFAIKALEAGKHVMSETTACKTLGEGVALCRAVEKSGRIYMLAENYPYTPFNQEMRRLYQAGEIGQVLYAEGEYNHPMPARDRNAISPGVNHWRNWTPCTYYCTHALAPLMTITDTMPVQVNALAISGQQINAGTARVSDPGSVILCRMDNGAVFRLFGLGMPGHSIWYRLHGERGSMESVRGAGYWGPGQVRIVHEPWTLGPGEVADRTYLPDFPEHAAEARQAGHGGGDFFTNFYFASAIRSGRQPYLNVYRGVAMSAVGILAWKSALTGGQPVDVPDFAKESSRRAYEADQWSPYPEDAAPDQPPASIEGHRHPTRKNLAAAERVWKEMAAGG